MKVLTQTDLAGQRVVNAGAPVDEDDLATKGYVDSTMPVFVQASAPSDPPVRYLWVQTELGSGTDITFWIEDGL